MRFFLSLVLIVGLSHAFTHRAPGESCTTSLNDLPNDADETNTYDYIFVGLGATSTVTASKLAKDLGCDVKILAIEAGRSFTTAPDCAPGSIDCFVQETENYYHTAPSGFIIQSVMTRGTWAFETRPQVYSDQVVYSDGRTTNCPYDIPGFNPQGCECVTDKYDMFSHLCSTYTACIQANPGNVAQCGTDPCAIQICGKNNTNLYWRVSSKGGSNSHHAMVTYLMSPFVADEWVKSTGDSRFSHKYWTNAMKNMDSEWLNLTFTSNHFSPTGTYYNDTLKYLIQLAGVEFGLNDLTSDGPDSIRNSDDFFNNPDKLDKYFSGFVVDQIVGRQVNRYNQKRSFPGVYLDLAMAECPDALITLCNTLVTKVLFADQGDALSTHAIGVEYVEGMDSYGLSFNYNKTATDSAPKKKSYARKGIIIGGGTFNSPQTLMLSGIGDQTHLSQFDIPVRKHLPAVGSNLEDDNEHTVHYIVTATGDPRAVNNTVDPGFGSRPYYVPNIIKAYFGHDSARFHPVTGVPINFPVPTESFCHAGAVAFGGRACPTIPGSNYTIPEDPSYLSSFTGDGRSFYKEAIFSGHVSSLTFFSSPEEKLQRKNPTCMALCGAGGYFKGYYDTFFHYGGAFGSMLSCDVLTSGVKSRGSIRLFSSNPSDPPIIDPNAYSVEEDLEHAGNCVNELRKIMDIVNQLSAENPSLYGNMHLTEYIPAFSAPGPSVSKTEVTPELQEWLKKTLWHHHPTGSNRMGNISDANSVVDSRGRVWGTSNLYVIDMSAIAVHPDNFPSTNAMVLGYLQAEALVSNHASTSNRVCNVAAFRGAQDANHFDTTANPLVAPLVVGYVLAGVFLLGSIAVAVYFSQFARAGGYKRL